MPTRDEPSTRGRGKYAEPSVKGTSGFALCSIALGGDSIERRHRRRRLPTAAAAAVGAADLLLSSSPSSSYFASATPSSSSCSSSFSSASSHLVSFLGLRRRSGNNSDGFDSDSDSDCDIGGSAPLSLPSLLARRPDALLAAAVPRAAVLFGAGAAAGALGKTITAPLDRVKLLLQTSGGFETGAIAAATSLGSSSAAATFSSVGRKGAQSVSRVFDALAAIGKQEGVAGYWRGNLPQILKVIPYSATQLCAYEVFKNVLTPKSAEAAGGPTPSPPPSLSVRRRLAAGAAAGMVATLVTHPFDTLRLRMAVDPAAKTLPAAVRLLASEGGGARAFYRGLGASIVGIAPYMAIELSTFDLLGGAAGAAGAAAGANASAAALPPFARGLLAAGLATTLCYPLDTARRRVQLGVSAASAASASASAAASAAAAAAAAAAVASSPSSSRSSAIAAQSAVSAAVREGKLVATALALAREEGLSSLYRGFLPSCLKNLPNKGVKLSVFDGAKRAQAASEVALAEERAKVASEREDRRRKRDRRARRGGLMRLFGGGSGGGGERNKRAILH